MPRPRPFLRAKLAWMLSGLMLAVVAGDWEAARKAAAEVLELLGKAADSGRPPASS